MTGSKTFAQKIYTQILPPDIRVQDIETPYVLDLCSIKSVFGAIFSYGLYLPQGFSELLHAPRQIDGLIEFSVAVFPSPRASHRAIGAFNWAIHALSHHHPGFDWSAIKNVPAELRAINCFIPKSSEFEQAMLISPLYVTTNVIEQE